MIKVYDLRTETAAPVAEFMGGVDPKYAVCYCYAEENKMLSKLFQEQEDDTLEEKFSLTVGKHSVCCGDFAAKL